MHSYAIYYLPMNGKRELVILHGCDSIGEAHKLFYTMHPITTQILEIVRV